MPGERQSHVAFAGQQLRRKFLLAFALTSILPLLVVTYVALRHLLAGFESAVTRGNITLTLKLDAADGGALAFAYRHAQVLERRDRGGKISLSLRIHPDDLGRFENRFAREMTVEQGIEAIS